VFVLALALVLGGCSSDGEAARGPDATASGTGGAAGTSSGVGGEGGNAPLDFPMGIGGGPGGAGGAEGVTISDDYVSDVEVAVLDFARTILEVTWTQTLPADETWVEFTFEEGNVLASPPRNGETGAHREVVLGVPAETEVVIRIVSSDGGQAFATSNHMGRTGAVPSSMPTPEVLSYDPALASPDRWLFGSVEDSVGGVASTDAYYRSVFWLYIMDRRGRIVWYYADPASNATSSFQRIARDGQYIWIEKKQFNSPTVQEALKVTLDGSFMEAIPLPGFRDCIEVTDDGSVLYDAGFELREMSRDGEIRAIWNCEEHYGDDFNCYTNTINWNPDEDTVVLSFPYEATVVEIDRQTGALLRQYGDAPGSWAFSPEIWRFEYQHFANVTPEGTLLVSSHMPGYSDTRAPVAGQHAFMEFERDFETETLEYKWHYQEGDEWAMFKGMAIRLPNGNTLANYGTGGVIREITPDNETAFHVKFDVEDGNDFFNKMVGHNVLIDDLYALNGGPE